MTCCSDGSSVTSSSVAWGQCATSCTFQPLDGRLLTGFEPILIYSLVNPIVNDRKPLFRICDLKCFVWFAADHCWINNTLFLYFMWINRRLVACLVWVNILFLFDINVTKIPPSSNVSATISPALHVGENTAWLAANNWMKWPVFKPVIKSI